MMIDNAYKIIAQRGGCEGILCYECPLEMVCLNNEVINNSQALKLAKDYVQKYIKDSQDNISNFLKIGL